MDHFMEEVVVLKNRTMNDVMYILSWVLMIFSGLVGFMELSGCVSALFSGSVGFLNLLPDILLGLGSAAVAVILFLKNDELKTEYEYTFTNGALDFAKVFNNKKRKNLGTLNVKNVEAFGKVTSAAFQRYVTMQDVKQTRWFLNRGAELYFFYFQKDSSKRLIILEPSEELVKNIQLYLPQGVTISK